MKILRLKIISIISFLILCTVLIAQDIQENGLILLNESFNELSNDWQGFYLKNSEGGSSEVSQNMLNISSANSVYGLYNQTAISGHFYVEVDISTDNHAMLALFHRNPDGSIDLNNYTSICVDSLGNGVNVYVSDNQDGNIDILDNTFMENHDNYRHVLNGQQYSNKFFGTNHKLRIFHDNISGFFHFYYAVKKEIMGDEKEGWSELFPSNGWAEKDQEYVVALQSNKGRISYDNLKMIQKPQQDNDDRGTGFKASWREYNWSGAFGKGLVVTFGEEFPYQSGDYKFVFWEEANNIPVWHLDNQFIFCNEFVETWNGGYPGCHEPMSDRLLRWSKVKLIEDNPVRKVVHWHYALTNPDYNYPNDWEGKQLPEADEFYYIYPDGQIIRQILYFPKLDTEFRKWNEIMEMIGIAGTGSNTEDHFNTPALTIMDLDGNYKMFHDGVDKNPFKSNDWNGYINSAHFKNHPDVFNAFIQDTIAGKKLEQEVTWHSTAYKMAHWPVNKIPYLSDFKTNTKWKGIVSHSSIIGAGSHTDNKWTTNYQQDFSGRKYRVWESLLGMTEPYNREQARALVLSWNSPGTISMNDSLVTFESYSRAEKAFIFNNTTSKSTSFSFDMIPDKKIINPVIKIENWGNGSISVNINGGKTKVKKFIYSSGDAIIWIQKEILKKATIKIETGNN